MHRLVLHTIIVILSFTSAGAQAHHSIGLNYGEEVGTVEGVVKDVFWANPHVHIYITVTNEDGYTEIWDLEHGIIQGLIKNGWTRDTVQPGDHITVSGRLGLKGRKRIVGRPTISRDGKVFINEGTVVGQPEAAPTGAE